MDSNKTILLLEDDMVDVMTIQRAMSQLGIKNPLVVKSNGEEGQSFLATATERPHLILLDINMPKMNGLEFLAMLKKNPEWRVIPVVILTTSEDHHDKWTAFHEGIAGYMVKPVDYDQFKSMMSILSQYWSYSQTFTG